MSYDRGDNAPSARPLTPPCGMFRGMGAQSVWRDDPTLYRDMLLF
ncbi:MAG: hypothetical protein R3F53_20680 [Gammaproteobacteria bacterium]